MNLIISSVGVILAVVYGFILFKIGQMKDRTLLFYVMAFIPIIPLALWLISLTGNVLTILFLQTYWWIFMILAIERIIWSFTLKDSSEQDKLGLFYLIFFLPIVGWIVYLVSKLR